MKATAFKTADHLKTQKDIVAYLNAALEDREPAVLLEALRNVAQARGGMGALAKAGCEPREPLPHAIAARQSQDRYDHGTTARLGAQAYDRTPKGGIVLCTTGLRGPAMRMHYDRKTDALYLRLDRSRIISPPRYSRASFSTTMRTTKLLVLTFCAFRNACQSLFLSISTSRLHKGGCISTRKGSLEPFLISGGFSGRVSTLLRLNGANQ
jgi:probable addiction module antidote protein